MRMDRAREGLGDVLLADEFGESLRAITPRNDDVFTTGRVAGRSVD